MSRRPAPHRGIDTAPDDGGRPSKSALKRQSQALQELGGQLAALPDEQLVRAPLGEPLREAIETYRRTRSHEGRRRQMQYVGKLMRDADEAALREAVAAWQLGSARDALALHEAEAWRARLLSDDSAFEHWLAAHPRSDAQQLRTLIRAARRDAASAAAGTGARQPRSFRELFRFIRPHLAPP
jgi:ribosome-associated protein